MKRLLLLIAMVLLASPRFAQAVDSEISLRQAPSQSQSCSVELMQQAQNVAHIGLFVRSVPEVDIKSNAFLADFFLWFRWKPELEFDPSQTFEIINAVDAWDILITPIYADDAGLSEPDVLESGELYQIFRVQARLNSPFDLRRYPLDSQKIHIIIEESDLQAKMLRYEWDRDGPLVDSAVQVPGWLFTAEEARITAQPYPTHFGVMQADNSEECYTRFTVEMSLERPLLGHLAKTVVPISLVMLITFVTFMIPLQYFEGRLGLAITSLISAVALQLTASDSLPDISYLVLLDKIYNLSYAVIFIAAAESVIAVRLADAGKQQASRKIDLSALVFSAILFFGGSAWMLLS